MFAIRILILILLSDYLIAGTIDPKVPDEKYIQYGKKHQCVVKITGVYGDSKKTLFGGSAVVIDKNYVLTAAHIVTDSISSCVIFNNMPHKIVAFVVHPDFDNDDIGYNDIAICKLEKPIVITFYPELYKGRDEMNKVCSLAGYGHTGTFSTGYYKYDNKKRAGANVIDDIHKNTLSYSVHKNKTKMELMISPGDSGGGLFIDKKLAGIHSFIISTDGKSDSDYGDVGCSTRVSDYIQWINDMKELLDRREN